MKLTDWLRHDDVAIGYIAVYYGLPAFGHPKRYKHLQWGQHAPNHVTREDLGEWISIKRCIHCGKLLVPAESEKKA